ncbi:MAG: hypothetical protein JRD68_10850 [Deltaproteobacteria bacterium]|nr:hypothetical protein [Deltaproteobacteria bacterium]
MIEKTLNQIAERIVSLDEASLTSLLPHYRKIMEEFEPTKEWEKAVIIFFLINSVRVKNTLFNENIMKGEKTKTEKKKKNPLKLIKS